MSYRLHTKCRACDSTELVPVFDLGLQPPSNDFQKNGDVRQGFYPLEVLFCGRCTLSQLSAVVDPEILYANYKYVTSNSETMRRHFDRLLKDILSEIGVPGSMLEIGSNDGTLLHFFKQNGFTVYGVDPARNLADIAERKGVPTYPCQFTPYVAGCVRMGVLGTEHQPQGTFRVVLGRHVFAHINGWKDFFSSVEYVSAKNSLIAIEVPYVHDLLKHAQFDTIYHEHLSYISITAIYYLLRNTPFNIHRVIRYGVHGGSLLIMLRHKDSGVPSHLSADEYLSEDAVTVQHWERFNEAAKLKITKMRNTVHPLVRDGKIVCGFGASAKATVWINACEFTKNEIRFVTDNSPLKPGRMIPGTDIPIIEQDRLLSEHPDYAVLFAWNYKDECLRSQSKWRERGGKFIIPTPDGVEIV